MFVPILQGLASLLPKVIPMIKALVPILGDLVVKNAGKLLELGVKFLPKVLETIQAVSEMLNITKSGESAEDLGARAMSTDKKVGDFKTTAEYVDYLRNEVTVDKDKLGKGSDIQSLKLQIIGASVMLKATSENLGIEVTPSFLKTTSSQKLAVTDLIQIVKAYEANDLNTADYSKYINKDLNSLEASKHSDALIAAFKTSYPDLSDAQIQDKVMTLINDKLSEVK